MTESWRERATRVRPAEDALIDRYRRAFFRGEAPAAGRGYPTIQTPWGVARGFHPAMHAADIQRRRAWPETQIVLIVFLEFVPDRRVIVMWPIWHRESWQDEEPPYNDVLDVNIAEAIHTRARSRLAVQPGPVVYFIGENRVDLSDPPAPGDPPAELLDARRKPTASGASRRPRRVARDGAGCPGGNRPLQEPMAPDSSKRRVTVGVSQ